MNAQNIETQVRTAFKSLKPNDFAVNQNVIERLQRFGTKRNLSWITPENPMLDMIRLYLQPENAVYFWINPDQTYLGLPENERYMPPTGFFTRIVVEENDITISLVQFNFNSKVGMAINEPIRTVNIGRRRLVLNVETFINGFIEILNTGILQSNDF